MNDNDLWVKVYSSGLVEVPDLDGAIAGAVVQSYATVHPGGRYTSAKVFMPRRLPSPWQVKEMQRIVIGNGTWPVWEGQIADISNASSGQQTGSLLTCIGAAGAKFNRTWNKAWADQRIDPAVWVQQTTAAMNDRCSLDRTARLRIVPNAATFAAGEVFALRYTMPIGQTVKRLTYTYALDEVVKSQPARVKYESSGTFTPMPYANDSDLTTYNAITWIMGDRLHVGVEQPDSCSGFRFHLTTFNAVTATLTAQYYDGATWQALTITDGTSVGGKTMAQDGDVLFTRPEDWLDAALGGSRRFYYIRFQISASLTAGLRINEITAIDPQAWEIVVYNVTAAADEAGTSIVATGTGTIDVTLATPSQSIELRLVSKASQTTLSNGSVFGQFTNVMVYSETGAVTPTSIVKNIRAHLTSLNADESRIDSNTFALTPFVSNGPEPITSLLQRAAAVGDASFNPWNVCMIASDFAPTPDGKPVLTFAAYPVLTGYDLVIALGEDNLLTPVEFARGILGSVYNWIIVKYRNLANTDVILTPDDQATLKDQTSIDTYEEQHLVLDGGQSTGTVALNLGRRTLAARKDPHYRSNQPLSVKGTIRTAYQTRLPACRIYAGLRLRVENWLTEDMTFLITGTDYDPKTQTNKLSISIPDNLVVWLAQRALIESRRLS